MKKSESSENSSKTIILKNVRISYPALFIPRSSGPNYPARYQANFLVNKEKNKEDIENIKKALICLEKEHNVKILRPNQNNNLLFSSQIATNIKDGDTLPDDHRDFENYQGYYIAGAKNKDKIKVISPSCREYTSESECPIWGGDYVNAKIVFWYLKIELMTRVGATLLAVQFLKKGDPFGKAEISEESLLEGFKEEEEEVQYDL
jgi:hypothetical protein